MAARKPPKLQSKSSNRRIPFAVDFLVVTSSTRLLGRQLCEHSGSRFAHCFYFRLWHGVMNSIITNSQQAKLAPCIFPPLVRGRLRLTLIAPLPCSIPFST